MVNKKYWFLIVFVMFTFYGCASNVIEKNTTEKLNIETIQEQNLMDKDIQKDELEKPKIGWANKLTNNIDYEIYFEKFAKKNKDTHTDILIEYPQIKNMRSLEIEIKVNKLLKEKAISVYGCEDIKGLNLPMKTKVECFNSNIISVKYTGYEYYFGAINGNDRMYATNINLKTGKIIDINNLFTDHFQEKLNRNVFKFNGVGKAVEGETIDLSSHEYGYINADNNIILEIFKNYYSNKTVDDYYFSEKYFNIIAKTPSGPTMYLELAASYNDLKDCMKNDDGFWNEILNLE